MIVSKIVAPVGGALMAYGAWTATDILLPPMIEGSGQYEAGPVAPGDVVLVSWTLTKRTECPGLTSREWRGGAGFYLVEPVQVTALPVGDDMRRDIQTKIPELAPAGPLNLHITGQFQCEGKAPQPFDLGPVGFVVK